MNKYIRHCNNDITKEHTNATEGMYMYWNQLALLMGDGTTTVMNWYIVDCVGVS